MSGPRIGIFGLFGECNAFREPIPATEYRWMSYHEGPSLMDAIRDPAAFLPPETRGFCAEMDATGPWNPVPLLYAISESGPLLAENHFLALLGRAKELLKAAGKLDGVYITGHGSLVAEQTKDCDAALLALIRAHVGPETPIVETLDPHGKITAEMVQLSDALVCYRTDPHTDMLDRGREAATLMRRLLAGERFSAALVRLPIMTTTAAIVAPSAPFRSGVELGVSLRSDAIISTSLVPGYPWTDSPYAGQHIVVYGARQAADTAAKAALQMAHHVWDRRHGYSIRMLSLKEMQQRVTALNADPQLAPLCFADLADNPGGGATSNTMYALQALLDVSAKDVAIGPIHDADVASAAHAAGLGARLEVEFNRSLTDPFAKPLSASAIVTGLADGSFHARSGPAAGVTVSQGMTAALGINGITVVVTSRPLQAMAVEQFEMVGVDLRKLRAVVVKSRGHYQAAFSEFFARSDMLEIDTPGWCTPHLERLPYRNTNIAALFPTNPDVVWSGAIDYLKRAG